jgi:hypothetical protein
MQPMTKAVVSPTMKRAAVVAGLIVLAGAIWYWRRPHSTTATPSTAAPSPATSSSTTAAAPSKGSAAPVRFDKVTRLANADERRRLAERIATAQAGRAATHAPTPPRLPDAEPPINKTNLRAAMRELIPMLTECYEAALPTLTAPTLEITASLHLSGDPDIGTIVDADALVDKATGKPLPAAFDDCMRSTFMQMALPPLAEGDTLEVHYPFMFSHE